MSIHSNIVRPTETASHMVDGAETHSIRLLIQAMWRTLRSYWTDAERYQKFTYIIGSLMILSAFIHFGIFMSDDIPWQGPVSWRKPVTFGLSLGSTLLTLSWILNLTPKWHRLNWTLMGLLGGPMIVEYVLIVMQVRRGVPSHFNMATSFDSTVFGIMGIMIATFGFVCLTITGLTFTRLSTSQSMTWAIRIGILILAVSQFLGFMIINKGNAEAFTAAGEYISSITKTATTYGAAGSMKVPHAVTLHAIQVLPILAWLFFFTQVPERRRLQAVLIAGAGYSGLVVVTILQMFRGVAPIELDSTATVLLVMSVLSIIAAYLMVLSALIDTVNQPGNQPRIQKRARTS